MWGSSEVAAPLVSLDFFSHHKHEKKVFGGSNAIDADSWPLYKDYNEIKQAAIILLQFVVSAI